MKRAPSGDLLSNRNILAEAARMLSLFVECRSKSVTPKGYQCTPKLPLVQMKIYKCQSYLCFNCSLIIFRSSFLGGVGGLWISLPLVHFFLLSFSSLYFLHSISLSFLLNIINIFYHFLYFHLLCNKIFLLIFLPFISYYFSFSYQYTYKRHIMSVMLALFSGCW